MIPLFVVKTGTTCILEANLRSVLNAAQQAGIKDFFRENVSTYCLDKKTLKCAIIGYFQDYSAFAGTRAFRVHETLRTSSYKLCHVQ